MKKVFRPLLVPLLLASLVTLPSAEAVRKRDRRAVKAAEAAAGATAISTYVAAKLTVPETAARVQAQRRLVSKGGVK
jgi:hypothetical protein